jgi:hypothetical protein
MYVAGTSALDLMGDEKKSDVFPEDSVNMTDYSSKFLFPDLEPDEFWNHLETENCKRYAGLLKSLVGVRGLEIALFPAGCPTTVNLLCLHNEVIQLCHYCPSGTFNAYCYLTKVCGADANILINHIVSKEIANCKDYYSEKVDKPGAGTPPYKEPTK